MKFMLIRVLLFLSKNFVDTRNKHFVINNNVCFAKNVYFCTKSEKDAL